MPRRRWRWPIPAATSIAARSGRCSRWRCDCAECAPGRARSGALGGTAAGAVGDRRPKTRRIAVSAEEIAREDRRPKVELVARAKLPLEDMPETQIVAFRAVRRRAGACRAADRRARRQAAAGPPAQRMPDRRRVRLAEMRLRAAAQGSAADHRRGRRRGAALPAPGRARHRPCQQAPRLCAAGSRSRHGRRQPPPRLRRRRARLRPCRGDAACARHRRGPAADQQSRTRSAGWKRRGSRSSSGCRTTCPPTRTTPIISRPSARRAGT